MKPEWIKRGTILVRVNDHAPWWADDYKVSVGDAFRYVGFDKEVRGPTDVIKVKPLNKAIPQGYWNLTLQHFIRADGSIARQDDCIWN